MCRVGRHVDGVELSGYAVRDLEFLNGVYDLHVLYTDELCDIYKGQIAVNAKGRGCSLF
jgi:hypothetical protein